MFSSNINQKSDDELLERYQKSNDTKSLGVLYNRYIHLVFGLCLKYLKSREEAQDAVMDVFESISDKLKTHQVSYFKSWLYMVAKNHCLMKLRKVRPSETFNGQLMENEIVMHPYTEEDNIDADLVALEECLKQLREGQQECVRMFYLNQKSYQEIVVATALKLSKVKSYIQNGKRNLKICLEGKNVKR